MLAIMNKFLNEKSPNFYCDDFNIDFQKHLRAIMEDGIACGDTPLGITMKIFISYDETDDLSSVSALIMDLDPENKVIVLAFEYVLTEEYFGEFKTGLETYKRETAIKIKDDLAVQVKNGKIKKEEVKLIFEKKVNKLFYAFFTKYHQDYFKIHRKTLFYDLLKGQEDEEKFIDLIKENIRLDKVINFKIIGAKREVSNRESDKSLSVLSSEY